MPTKRKCNVCWERPAEVPDRNVMGRPIKRVCKQCHAARLAGDLRSILAIQAKRKEVRRERT